MSLRSADRSSERFAERLPEDEARLGSVPTAKQSNLITGLIKGTSPMITRCHVANDVEQLAKNAAY